MVLIGEMLHAQVPALVMSVVDELARDNMIVLSRDRRHGAIGNACAFRAVAGGAGLKQRLAMHEVGLAA